MKIALPSDGQQVDSHFGHCQCFTVFTVDDENKIASEETLTPPPGCGCKSNVVPELANMGVSVMLAGNMGGGAVNGGNCIVMSEPEIPPGPPFSKGGDRGLTSI